MPSAAGHSVRVSYLHEDDSSGNPDFNATPNDSDDKPFGSDAAITTLEGSNEAVRVFDPNSREAREIIEQAFAGSWAVEFTMTNPWWIRETIHNGVSTSGTSAPFTHTMDGSVPYSMQITIGNESTLNERTLNGCVVTSARISADVGGMVRVTLEGAYADESQDTSPTAESDLKAQPSLNERPLTFAKATLERPQSTTLSLIQRCTLSIENNTDIIRELGSRFGKDYSPKVRALSVEYTDIVEDDNELTRMYGDASTTSPQSDISAEEETMRFLFDNGKTGSDKNLIKFDMTKATPTSYSRSGGGNPEADLEGTLRDWPATIKGIAENSQSSAR